MGVLYIPRSRDESENKPQKIYEEELCKYHSLGYTPSFDAFWSAHDDYCVDETSDENEIRAAVQTFLNDYTPAHLKQDMAAEAAGKWITADIVKQWEREGFEFVFNTTKEAFISAYDFDEVQVAEYTDMHDGDKEAALKELKSDLADKITEVKHGIVIRWWE